MQPAHSFHPHLQVTSVAWAQQTSSTELAGYYLLGGARGRPAALPRGGGWGAGLGPSCSTSQGADLQNLLF